MVGVPLEKQNEKKEVIPENFFVKEAVFPFNKFPGVDIILGPEMKSTGEVMGVGSTFGEAFAKSLEGASVCLPRSGKALISVREADRNRAIRVASDLVELKFEIFATRGTANAMKQVGIECRIVNKVAEGRPHIVDMIKNDDFSLIINTTEGKQAIIDSRSIRAAALQHKVSYTTTISGAEAAVLSLKQPDDLSVKSLQELH